jgi:aldehyde:ferredoxin oxidoreductase
MASGYAGKILRIDLSERTTRVESVDDLTLRRYLGGGLLGHIFC